MRGCGFAGDLLFLISALLFYIKDVHTMTKRTGGVGHAVRKKTKKVGREWLKRLLTALFSMLLSITKQPSDRRFNRVSNSLFFFLLFTILTTKIIKITITTAALIPFIFFSF